MNDELVDEAKELVGDFTSLDLYKKYIVLKEELESNIELNKLKKEKDYLQKNLKNYHGIEKDNAFKMIKEMNEEYFSSPLVVNFNTVKKQLEELLMPFIEFEF